MQFLIPLNVQHVMSAIVPSIVNLPPTLTLMSALTPKLILTTPTPAPTPTLTPTHKWCKFCSKEKPLTDFDISKAEKHGRKSKCKNCRSIERKSLAYEKQTGLKPCPRCKVMKDRSEFNRDRREKDGCQSYCKDCHRTITIAYNNTLEGFMSRLFGNLSQNAVKRGLNVEITFNDLIELYHRQNGRCAITNLEMTHQYGTGGGKFSHNISVDRINSTRHYTRDNIHLVCSIVNQMKWDTPYDQFINMCLAIADNHRNRVLQAPQIVNPNITLQIVGEDPNRV